MGKIAAFMKSFTAKLRSIQESLKAINQMNGLSPSQRGGLARQILASSDPEDMARKEVARLRAMTPAEKEKVLALSGGMTESQKIQAAEESIRQVSRRDLTQGQRSAIVEAHRVGGAGRNFDYTPSELREKYRILRSAGFSEDEAQVLMRKGIAGSGRDSVAGQVRFSASSGASNTVSTPLVAENALKWNASTEMRAEARSYYTDEGRRLVGHQTDRARDYFIYSGDISEYAGTIRSPSLARSELDKRKKELRSILAEKDMSRSQTRNRPLDQFYSERIKSYQKAIDHLEEYLKAGN